jgi:hypothetical protein
MNVHLVGLISLECTRQDTSSASVSEEDRTVSEETARGNLQSNTGASSLQSEMHA